MDTTHNGDRRNGQFGRSYDPTEDRFDRHAGGDRVGDDEDRSWFDRAKDNMRGWFRGRDVDPEDADEHRRYEEARRRYEDERRRYDDAHDRYMNRFAIRARRYDYQEMGRDDNDTRSSLGGVRDRSEHGDLRVRAQMREEDRRRYGDMPDDRYYRDGLYRDSYNKDDRERYADTDDNPRGNWRGWSGRSFTEDIGQRDRNVGYDRARLVRDDRGRYASSSYDDRYGHSSIRGNRLDYDHQWASDNERNDGRRRR